VISRVIVGDDSHSRIRIANHRQVHPINVVLSPSVLRRVQYPLPFPGLPNFPVSWRHCPVIGPVAPGHVRARNVVGNGGARQVLARKHDKRQVPFGSQHPNHLCDLRQTGRATS
jgi:hypothetical protein